MRSLSSAVLFLAALLPAPGGANPPAVKAFSGIFDIHLGGFKVGELTVDSIPDHDAYLAEASFHTVGIVAFFIDEQWRGQTEGQIVDGEMVPLRYLSRQFRQPRDKLREVTFSHGTPVSVAADPPVERQPWSIDVADQAPAVDPATALASLIAPGPGVERCGQRIEIYDGKHRFAFDLGPAEPDGDGLVCEGAHLLLAGYKPQKLKSEGRRPFKLYLERRDDGLWQMARVTTPTPLGDAVMRPRD